MKSKNETKLTKNTAMFRLYTEDCGNLQSEVLPLIAEYTEGATVYKALGIWQGEVEDSLVIEIHHKVVTKHDINDGFARYKELAKRIAELNNQQAVRVVHQEVTVVDVVGG